jgi:hypothetical protein
MKFPKIYLEITNVCNLSCSFCKGTERSKAFLSVPDFRRYAAAVRPYTDYLYLHVMGEPLLHPELENILDEAAALGFRVCLTTNGTLLPGRLEALADRAKALYKISVSLHAFEANTEARTGMTFSEYLDGCLEAAETLGRRGVIVALRLWNCDNPDAVAEYEKEPVHHDAHVVNFDKLFGVFEGFIGEGAPTLCVDIPPELCQNDKENKIGNSDRKQHDIGDLYAARAGKTAVGQESDIGNLHKQTRTIRNEFKNTQSELQYSFGAV